MESEVQEFAGELREIAAQLKVILREGAETAAKAAQLEEENALLETALASANKETDTLRKQIADLRGKLQATQAMATELNARLAEEISWHAETKRALRAALVEESTQ